MRFTLTGMISAACVLAAACGNDSADDNTVGSLPDMDTTATGAAVAPAAEVGTSPGDDADSDAVRGADTIGADRGNDDADDRAGAAPPADMPGRDDDDDDDLALIPARFHGEWNADRAACGTGSSETRLRISASEVRFYESVGVVRSVDTESERVIAVSAEYQGEGQTWQDERRMTLSEDGSSLTISNGGDLVRYRCP